MIMSQGDLGRYNDAVYGAIKEINDRDPAAQLLQIKIKFGGLRFYVASRDPVVQTIARRAEAEADRS